MPSGEIYHGCFEDDKRNGIGTSSSIDHTIVSVTGEWKDGEQVGLAKTVNSDGSMTIAYQSYSGIPFDNTMIYIQNKGGGYFIGVEDTDGLKGHFIQCDRQNCLTNWTMRNGQKNGYSHIKIENSEFSCMMHNSKKHGSGIIKYSLQAKKFRIYAMGE